MTKKDGTRVIKELNNRSFRTYKLLTLKEISSFWMADCVVMDGGLTTVYGIITITIREKDDGLVVEGHRFLPTDDCYTKNTIAICKEVEFTLANE